MSTCLEFVVEEPIAFGLTELPAVEMLPANEADESCGCGVPGELIVYELPSSFWKGLADCDNGRVVDLDTALDTPPPNDE